MEQARPTQIEIGIVLALVTVVAISIWAGRQLFLDGTSYIVHPMLDAFWYPHPTPRRFFAIIWSTIGPRLVGIFAPDRVALGALLFGCSVYLLILLPIIAICRSQLESGLCHALLAMFVSGSLVLANWPVGEFLFAFAATTLFTLYTLQPTEDAKGWKRLGAALLLIASYETITVTNLILLASTSLAANQDSRPRPVRLATIAALCAGPVFQIGFYLMNPWPSANNVLNFFVVQLAALLGGHLLLSLLLIHLLQRWRPLIMLMAVGALGLPILLLLFGEGLYLRTRLFQYAYPARVYSFGISLIIAMVPLLAALGPWQPLRRVTDRFSRAMPCLSLIMAATFAGISILASADAYRYRTAFEAKLSQLSGILNVSACDLCTQPHRFGLPDLGLPWVWPRYSMAHTMRRQDRPAVVLIVPEELDSVGDVTREVVEEFYERQTSQRDRSSNALSVHPVQTAGAR